MTPRGLCPPRECENRLGAIRCDTGVPQFVVANQDHAEVGALSCRVMSQHVCQRLQLAVCFLRDPIPLHPTAFLTVDLPRGRMEGLTTFPR